MLYWTLFFSLKDGKVGCSIYVRKYQYLNKKIEEEKIYEGHGMYRLVMSY